MWNVGKFRLAPKLGNTDAMGTSIVVKTLGFITLKPDAITEYLPLGYNMSEVDISVCRDNPLTKPSFRLQHMKTCGTTSSSGGVGTTVGMTTSTTTGSRTLSASSL